jgi:hypothetical protein
MSEINIPEAELAEIEKAIASDQSVVGIDAKKTHVIIIHMLNTIQKRLDSMEQRLIKIEKNQD